MIFSIRSGLELLFLRLIDWSADRESDKIVTFCGRLTRDQLRAYWIAISSSNLRRYGHLWFLNKLMDMSTSRGASIQGDSRRGLRSATLHSWIRYSSASCWTWAPNGSLGFLYLALTKKSAPMIAFTGLQGLLLTLARYFRDCSSRRRFRGSIPAYCSSIYNGVVGRAPRAITKALCWTVLNRFKSVFAAQA